MQVISQPKKYLFFFLDVIQGKYSKYRLDFYFKSEKYMKKHYQIWLLSEEKYINLICIITHFRDRHFTIILWPQCSLGTSTLEHLSTASSCHTSNQAKNNIYTDVMATLSQRKWPYTDRLCIRNGWRRQRTNRKPLSNNETKYIYFIQSWTNFMFILHLHKCRFMYTTQIKNTRKPKSHVDGRNIPVGNHSFALCGLLTVI